MVVVVVEGRGCGMIYSVYNFCDHIFITAVVARFFPAFLFVFSDVKVHAVVDVLGGRTYVCTVGVR